MLINPAYAQSAGGFGNSSSLLVFVLIFVIFYFLLIRPQQKRAKAHREMIGALRRGDKIVTSGGLTGTISKVVEDMDTVEVEIAKDVKVNIMRNMVVDLKNKTDKTKSAEKGDAQKPKSGALAALFGPKK